MYVLPLGDTYFFYLLLKEQYISEMSMKVQGKK